MKRLKIIKEIINTEVTYKVDKYCCEPMEKALTITDRNESVGGYATFRWQEKQLVVDIHETSHYDSRTVDEETKYKVKYCPFCGEKI